MGRNKHARWETTKTANCGHYFLRATPKGSAHTLTGQQINVTRLNVNILDKLLPNWGGCRETIQEYKFVKVSVFRIQLWTALVNVGYQHFYSAHSCPIANILSDILGRYQCFSAYIANIAETNIAILKTSRLLSRTCGINYGVISSSNCFKNCNLALIDQCDNLWADVLRSVNSVFQFNKK